MYGDHGRGTDGTRADTNETRTAKPSMVGTYREEPFH